MINWAGMATPWTPATDKMLKAEHFAAMKSNVRQAHRERERDRDTNTDRDKEGGGGGG